MRFWRKRSSAAGREGFVYVGAETDDIMRDARVGASVRVEGRGPPWIVVAHEPGAVLVARWPGRLWYVRITEAATADDQRSRGGAPAPYARYTRAISVEVLREENASVLFGANGRGVIQVLNRAKALTRPEAEKLAQSRHADAGRAYDRSWRAWLASKDISADHYADFDGTLAGPSTFGSPINNGLSVIETTVFNRARALDGDFAVDSDEEEMWLLEPWRGASGALLDAALAMGAPEIMSEKDRSVLLSAWAQAFG